jgi:hypothetical protein
MGDAAIFLLTQGEPTSQCQTDEEKSEADEELSAFADCRNEGAARCIPLFNE